MLRLAPTEEECAVVLEEYERLRATDPGLYAMFDTEPRVLPPAPDAFLPFKRD